MLLRRYYQLIISAVAGSATGSDVCTFYTFRPSGVRAGWARGYANGGRWLCFRDVMGKVLQTAPTDSDYSSVGVYFGDGTTEVQPSDYFLSGNLISGISVTSSIELENERNGRIDDPLTSCTVRGIYTVKNNNDTDITISECVLVTMAQCLNSALGLYGAVPLAVDRTLLEQPVTIAPGEIGVVTYEIKMSYSG